MRAPCDDDDLPRMRRALASTEAGRALLPILEHHLEHLEPGARGARVFTHAHDRCVHLRLPEPDRPAGACALHEAGGLDALSAACRNYPRSVVRVLDDIEVAFYLACPTVARLLVADPSPLRMIERAESPTYPPTSTAPARVPLLPGLPERDLPLPDWLALRAAWWQALAAHRADPGHLLGVLSLLAVDPTEPPAPGTHGASYGTWPGLVTPDHGLTAMEARFFLAGLERLPDRGATYAAHYWEVRRELTAPHTEARLRALLTDLAPQLAAFVELELLFAGLHDRRPLQPYLRTIARRAVGVARAVDALCDRVPFGLDTLTADALAASALVEPLTAP